MGNSIRLPISQKIIIKTDIWFFSNIADFKPFLNLWVKVWGRGLIYDTDLNITWLQDANYAKTSGYDTDGDMLYPQANAFIASLNSTNFRGYSDWRLPKADPSCSTFECPNSEMGHLYYTELGNTSAGSTHSGPFIDLCLQCIYWMLISVQKYPGCRGKQRPKRTTPMC